MHDRLTLADWRRRVTALYEEVRTTPDPGRAWERWRAVRNELFREHPQSPLPEAEREQFPGLPFFDYDPALRVLAEVLEKEREHYEIQTSGDGTYGFSRFAEARFEVGGVSTALELYWLDGYVGGVFVPFRDATGGSQTYGAGRYLLDTGKGADLGMEGERLVLDFNFSYNPSCAYDPQWVCPLAPPPNRIEVPIRAGERAPAH
ncbi:MAG TPA: DUF1684 domain-containing protein [Actinomycetota bacterium]